MSWGDSQEAGQEFKQAASLRHMQMTPSFQGERRPFLSRVCAQLNRTPLIHTFLGDPCHRRLVAEMGCSFDEPLTVFDVGANDGTSFIPLARRCPWISVHAFEPTPQLVQRIRERTKGLENYQLVPKAVGETPGHLPFNVAGLGDWGCSSLLEFSDHLDKTWPGRTDLKVTERIEVEVMRLETYVQEQRIERVDFLHVDTQGTDLAVLRSLGPEIRRVRAGVVEVPQSNSVALYRGQHTREEAFDFLREHGFAVKRVIAQQNEDNVYYYRP